MTYPIGRQINLCDSKIPKNRGTQNNLRAAVFGLIIVRKGKEDEPRSRFVFHAYYNCMGRSKQRYPIRKYLR